MVEDFSVLCVKRISQNVDLWCDCLIKSHCMLNSNKKNNECYTFDVGNACVSCANEWTRYIIQTACDQMIPSLIFDVYYS